MQAKQLAQWTYEHVPKIFKDRKHTLRMITYDKKSRII